MLRHPAERLYLAGKHLSYLPGWQAGAIELAWLRIAKLHRRASARCAGPASDHRNALAGLLLARPVEAADPVGEGLFVANCPACRQRNG